MSGVVKADRIARENVSDTMFSYYSQVLYNIPEVGLNLYISGSWNSSPDKADFGDLDFIIKVDAPDLKTAKKILINEFAKNPYIIPFEYKGKIKKFNNTGELLSVKFKQANSDLLTVQIDNIICLTDDEFEFKKNFLNLPCEVQGLYLGLIKVYYSEVLGSDYLEYDLSSSSIRLRDMSKNINVIAKYTKWTDVLSILTDLGVDPKWKFEELLQHTKTLSERSRRRIKGLFCKMVSIKSGEIGTEKAANKQKCIDMVNEL